MNEIKALEHPTLKVPYEVFNKKYRQAQKILDSETKQVSNVASEIEVTLNKENVPAEDIKRLLGGMVEKLQSMKRKASDAINEELAAGCVCKRRLDHLKEHATAMSDASTPQITLNQWRKQRLDRKLIDYLLRHGYYAAASDLADKTGLKDLTNVDIFETAREVERELSNRETGRCLQWCADNKSKLRKMKSTMEFKLRMQEFIELVRQDRRMDAVRHARRHFSQHDPAQLPHIQRCMGMLAFPKDSEVYAELYCESRWSELVLQFRAEHSRVLAPAAPAAAPPAPPPPAPLMTALQVGLAALKTPQCYSSSSKVASCPVCSPALNCLAACLPHAHVSQSRLVCRISGRALNEHNQPMMLPNGQVYGEQALKEMMKEHGAIICPKTKEVFCINRAEKVFVM